MSDLKDVLERIDAVLSYPELSRDLAAGLSLIRPQNPAEELDALVSRVRGRFETSRNYRVVLQFLQNHSRLTDQELVRLFEFIYSKLVNKFKGELGEVLAARTLFELPSMLGAGVEVLHGTRISARQLVRRGGWYDAADALYCIRDGDRYDVVAIAEVKSRATPFAAMREQVVRNILRLRRGFRLDGEEVIPERIRIIANGRPVPAAAIDDEHAHAVTALLVVPWTSAAEAAAVELLIAIAAGEDVAAPLRRAVSVIESVRETVRLHEQRGWGFPDKLTMNNARAAVIDLAVAHVLLGDPDAALSLLLKLRGVQPSELELMANDPVLAPVTRAEGALERIRSTTQGGGLAVF